ncbi:hypothetical protein HK097_004324 [Rhizophlyctis rosea]|uniref:P-type ATPase C-terminal domain-containing protein n=1 Tax=Rhizophlyctis rosea TaxID=64517 RepID=A0AAD5WZK6_9FUNG|nr:hypothetical protein HK097_004324 [Rhizophlyctis rosea]
MKEALERFFGGGEVCGKERNKSVRGGRVAPETELPPPYSAHQRFALIIDGSALRHALHPTNAPVLLHLALKCTTVICCRVSPLQKAQIVQLVKQNLPARCLAIGDGANDVSMIQAADVGVGIAGEEGVQAVMSADYAIGQFRFLGRLLLVHGRWCYRRIAEMILTFFAKNIVWVTILFWYQIYCGLSQTLIYEYTYMLLYNLVFSSLPIGLLGVLDQDVPAFAALLVPPLYRPNIANALFTTPRFLLYILEALYISLVIFFTAFLTFKDCALYGNGRPEDSRILAVVLATCGVINSNMLVVVNSSNWNVVNATVIFGSDLLVFLWTVVYGFMPGSDLVGIVVQVFGNVWFWTTLVFVTWVSCLPRFLCRCVGRFWWPSDVDIVREACKVEGGVEELVWSGRLFEADGVSGMEMGKGKGEVDIGDGVGVGRIGSVRGGVGVGGGPPAMTVVEAIPTLEPDTSSTEIPDTTVTPPTPTAAGPFVPHAQRIGSAPPRLNARLSMRSIPARMTSNIQDSSFFDASQPHHQQTASSSNTSLPASATHRVSLITTPTSLRPRDFTTDQSPSTVSFAATPQLSTADSFTDQQPTTPHLTVMSTHEILRNRGYSFSQSAGGRDVILSATPQTPSGSDDEHQTPYQRRRSRAKSMVARAGRSLDNVDNSQGGDSKEEDPTKPVLRAHTGRDRKARKRAFTEGSKEGGVRPSLDTIMASPATSKPVSRTVSRNSRSGRERKGKKGGGEEKVDEAAGEAVLDQGGGDGRWDDEGRRLSADPVPGMVRSSTGDVGRAVEDNGGTGGGERDDNADRESVMEDHSQKG